MPNFFGSHSSVANIGLRWALKSRPTAAASSVKPVPRPTTVLPPRSSWRVIFQPPSPCAASHMRNGAWASNTRPSVRRPRSHITARTTACPGADISSTRSSLNLLSSRPATGSSSDPSWARTSSRVQMPGAPGCQVKTWTPSRSDSSRSTQLPSWGLVYPSS